MKQNTCKITFITQFLQKFVTNGKSESGNLSGEIWLQNWFYMYFATNLILIGFLFRHKKTPIMSDWQYKHMYSNSKRAKSLNCLGLIIVSLFCLLRPSFNLLDSLLEEVCIFVYLIASSYNVVKRWSKNAYWRGISNYLSITTKLNTARFTLKRDDCSVILT